MAKEIAEEYASSLADLTVNSKPLINMLTILAEENVEHAGVIVETVEKHLEKVNPEIKLPVLYLVDSIIKNVGGAYIQKFSERIVNIFTRTFKQVDEKTRSQMFKLRETWHDVFPATKLYQLDVKVNLIDPAWPIQAQPVVNNHGHQHAIHVNPNFLKKPASSSAAVPTEEERMKQVLAKKEQELLMLQRKKIEMELEATRRQLELAEKQAKKLPSAVVATPAALVVPPPPALGAELPLTAKARLGPPVPKPAGASRIAPVSAALVAARRDPRLQRSTHAPHSPAPPALAVPMHMAQPIASNVFDIKPLDRVTKRKNVITFDVTPDITGRPAPEDPRRRDPRHEKRPDRRDRDKTRDRKREDKPDMRPDRKRGKPDLNVNNHKDTDDKPTEKDLYTSKYQIPDPIKINKLPPIPKINRDENKDKDAPSPVKKRREVIKNDKKKGKDSKSSSLSSSPEKKASPEKRKTREKKTKEAKEKQKQEEMQQDEDEVIAFKELKNYHKEHYMRRNKEKSESPDPTAKNPSAPKETDVSNVAESESKDVDLRVLPSVVEPKPAPVQKRPSTESVDAKIKKTKLDKFDILFGNEDVDLRQLPQVEELPPAVVAPPPPILAPTVSPPKPPLKAPRVGGDSPKAKLTDDDEMEDHEPLSPAGSPKKDWNEVKDKARTETDQVKKTPTKLDLVRAKLAEATKGKDRLGRPLLFGKSPSVERERRRTISSEDTDLRTDNPGEFDAEDNKKTISIIMNQAKQQYSDGQLDKNQYNTLMYQVLQLNEKLKLKEAKQRESLELSKMKLKATTQGNIQNPNRSPNMNTNNTYGDIDERVIPAYMDTPPDSQGFKDSDMRMPNLPNMPVLDMDQSRHGLLPAPPVPPIYNPYGSWRGPKPRNDEYVPRRFRGANPAPYFRPRFEPRAPRVPFEPRLPLPPPPSMGMCQGENPLLPYERVSSPPPLGTPSIIIPPTNYRVLEYIDQDPVKTIQIDGVPREIRFYGETAVIMLEWDDPREIKFLPGCRRATFDNKDSVVLSFNEPYKQVEIDDQTFNIRYGAPTRELYINGRWYECFFGGGPLGVIIDGHPRVVQLEGPLPQVDIGKVKRTDLVAGKINLIVNATQMCPLYLDAKVQKFSINNHFFTIRFVDALRTVLINEVPFKVEYGFLPKPIVIGNEKFFIRFSALPRGIKPGMIQIAGMEGTGVPALPQPVIPFESIHVNADSMDVDEDLPRPPKTPSPEGENQGLDLLASVMPSSIEAPASASAYSLAEPLFSKPDKIPGLDTSGDDKPSTNLTILGNINVTDLFAKLVATGIVQMPADKKEEKTKEEIVTSDSSEKENKDDNEIEMEKSESPKKEVVKEKEEEPEKPKEDRTIHRVDLLRPETLRVKQPGLVSKLYGGMQCSGCGARFPPEHTVRYSQHLDWHFRQNRKERDSARRAHSRHWHYDLCDWVQYEEIEDLDEREKSWFETSGAEGESEPAPEVESEAPSVAAETPTQYYCALCGDRFQQFYNEDQEEWHLRNSLRHEGNNYHPMCFEDYKATQAKDKEAEAAPAEPTDEVINLDRTDEPIEIREDDNSQSDAESEVELIEDKQPTLEIEDVEEEEDEDDVVFKAEPVVEVTVEDDADTDDETQAERKERDKQAQIDYSKVKVKLEPVDPDDEPIMTAVEEAMKPAEETRHPSVLTSIDGNVQLESTALPASTLPLGGIRINITKTIPTIVSAPTNLDINKDFSDISVDDEPLPPGEEPVLEYKLKPQLEGVEFSRQPPLRKGNELSGLCSIM